MVTADDTKVIDPEFAFYGPIGFDVGMSLANFWMACHAAAGQGAPTDAEDWLLGQAEALWQGFADRFAGHMRGVAEGGSLYTLARSDAALLEAAIAQRLARMWDDALGFAGCEIIRRILGLAHVADFESIPDEAVRADCERRSLHFGRRLLVERTAFLTIAAVTAAARMEAVPA
jgi:5-methylthioribose kinase